MSDELKAATKALIAAQQEMSAPKKDTVNPFFKSKYADLGAVMEACHPALHKHGFAVFQRGGHDEAGEYVECVFQHEAGHAFTSRLSLRLVKPDMQALGSAVTYARRYTLQALAGLSAEDDDGNAAVKTRKADTPDDAIDYAAARDRIKEAIGRAENVDDLVDAWKDNADTIMQLKAEKPAMFAQLNAAKNDRKKALTEDTPLEDGEIPF